MGYTTSFEGSFKLSRELTVAESKYLHDFSGTSHMALDTDKLLDHPGYIAMCSRLRTLKLGHENEAVGPMGCFWVEEERYKDTPGTYVLNHNASGHLPGLWCQWVPTEDNKGLAWDGNEKFYEYIAWLEWLVISVFNPWGVKVTGFVKWQGEEMGDRGLLRVVKGKVSIKHLQ